MTVKQATRQLRTLNKDITNIRTRQIQTQLKISEYQEAYVAWPWQPRRESMKPAITKVVQASRPKLKTINQCTFVAHKASQRPKPICNKKGNDKQSPSPAAKMLAETTYEKDYTRKRASRPAAFKPHETPVSSGGPFDSNTVYERTFTSWTAEQLAEAKVDVKVPEDNLKTPNNGKIFQATTTVKEDYKNHGSAPPAKSTKPVAKPLLSKTPFLDETTNRADFTAKKPASPVEAFKPKEEYRFRSAPFDDLTIFRRDFPEHKNVKKEQSYKPKNVYAPSAIEFDDRTTQRTAYQAWPIPKQEHLPWAVRPSYIPNRAKLQLVTSYQCDFENPDRIIPHALDKCRPATCKYENNLGASDAGSCDYQTEYGCTFIAWNGVRRPASYKIIEKYQYPKTPFSGESTFTSHFKGVHAPPAKSCRPERRPHSSSGDPSFNTTYRANYDEKTARPRPMSCPAVPRSDSREENGSDATVEHGTTKKLLGSVVGTEDNAIEE